MGNLESVESVESVMTVKGASLVGRLLVDRLLIDKLRGVAYWGLFMTYPLSLFHVSMKEGIV